ncbi:ef hand family protein [Stylonychia lemnae]|uniref:Ef hand family protein n=1 Tax=Stylonychia lemnae TaxID=5949 RepID=A0A078AHU5_STYLE|nr:ef hand family protein [Stylonychia lemnae]|eukprot:CDW81077.1 ef hand family protein [Stylonychia lemnae]
MTDQKSLATQEQAIKARLVKALQQLDHQKHGVLEKSQLQTMLECLQVRIENYKSKIHKYTLTESQAVVKSDIDKIKYFELMRDMVLTEVDTQNFQLVEKPIKKEMSKSPRKIPIYNEYLNQSSDKIAKIDDKIQGDKQKKEVQNQTKATGRKSPQNQQNSDIMNILSEPSQKSQNRSVVRGNQSSSDNFSTYKVSQSYLKSSGNNMKSLMDYGHGDNLIRKSESPDFFSFKEEKKLKTIDYFSPLKATQDYFPGDQAQKIFEKMQSFEIDQRTMNHIRREFLKLDQNSTGSVSVEIFKQALKKVCSNEITKFHLRDMLKLFANGTSQVDYQFIKALSYLIMFWNKPPNKFKNDSTFMRDVIQQNQNQNTQVRTYILELLNKLQGKLEQKYPDLKSAFRFFDVNNSGDISLEEFQLTLDILQLDINEDQSMQIFKFLDTNADGNISLDEFSQIYYEQRQRLQGRQNNLNMQDDLWTTLEQDEIRSNFSKTIVKDNQSQNFTNFPRTDRQQSGAKQDRLKNHPQLEDYLQQFQKKKEIDNKLSDYGYISSDNKSVQRLEKKREGKSFIDRYRVNNTIDKTFQTKNNFQTLQHSINQMERSFDATSQRSGAESLLQKLRQNQKSRQMYFEKISQMNRTFQSNSEDKEDGKAYTKKQQGTPLQLQIQKTLRQNRQIVNPESIEKPKIYKLNKSNLQPLDFNKSSNFNGEFNQTVRSKIDELKTISHQSIYKVPRKLNL